MKSREPLTNEVLTNALADKFRLTHIAIGIARHKILSDQHCDVIEVLKGMQAHPENLQMEEIEKAS